MIELFLLYKYAFVLCFIAGAVLCLQGTHLMARKEGLQILALAQAALVGNLIGRLFFPLNEVLIIISSLVIFCSLKIFLSFKKNDFSSETFFIVVYLSLMSISYLLISLFPGLEGHMSVGFFGDIVSLSEHMTIVLIFLFFIFLCVFIIFRKTLFRRSFEVSVLKFKNYNLYEEVLFALVLVCSLYGLGFLYSVATMIFPVVIIGAFGKNLKSILIIMVGTVIFSGVSGLAMSIAFERLSTVPSQIILMLFSLLFVGALCKRGAREKN